MKKNKKGKLDILFEDKHVLIVNKKGGLPTIKSENCKDNLYSQVYDYLHKKNQRVFVVHRLDKDTSGIILFAKTEEVKNKMQQTWDKTKREYIALVEGYVVGNNTIKSYLKETKTLYTYSTNNSKEGKLAVTKYDTIYSNKEYSLLKIEILTGRKNQIRVHMKDIKHPIVGDKKYGSTKNPIRRMCLHANYFSFIHPILNKNIEVKSIYPKIFDKLINKM